MRIREMFPKDGLAAEDLRGKDVTLTIDSVEWNTVGHGSDAEKIPAVFFRELKGRKESNGRGKYLRLNVTNAKQIAKLCRKVHPDLPAGLEGETDNWTGLRITLFPTTCQAFGDPNTPCIRVRPNAPPQKGKPKPAPDLEAEPDPEPPPDLDGLEEEAAE